MANRSPSAARPPGTPKARPARVKKPRIAADPAAASAEPVDSPTEGAGDRAAAGEAAAKDGPPGDGEAAAAPRRRRTNAPQLLRRKAKAKPAPEAAAADADDSAEEGEVIEGIDPAELAELLPEGDAARGKADFLVTYFKDLTRLSVLSPAAEFELARRIGIMEEVLWVQLLSLAPLTEHLVELIEADLVSPLAVADLARRCRVSESTLLRAFKRELGCTPGAYARGRRMDEALALLRAGCFSITEVAGRVGYDNPTSFSHAFQLHFGNLPSSFLRRAQAGKR